MYDVSLANGTTLTQCMFALTGVPPDQLSLWSCVAAENCCCWSANQVKLASLKRPWILRNPARKHSDVELCTKRAAIYKGILNIGGTNEADVFVSNTSSSLLSHSYHSTLNRSDVLSSSLAAISHDRASSTTRLISIPPAVQKKIKIKNHLEHCCDHTSGYVFMIEFTNPLKPKLSR